MIYSHFYRHNSFCTVFWVSSFYLSVNIVLYQLTVTCIKNWSVRSLGQWIIESKVYQSINYPCLDGKKRFKIAIMFLGRRLKNEWICESRYMSSNKGRMEKPESGIRNPEPEPETETEPELKK